MQDWGSNEVGHIILSPALGKRSTISNAHQVRHERQYGQRL